MDHLKDAYFSFSEPAHYQIKVLGELSQEWSELLRGMEVVEERGEHTKPVCIITGKISDQTALAGILNTLYEFHLPVIFVKKMEDPANT